LRSLLPAVFEDSGVAEVYDIVVKADLRGDAEVDVARKALAPRREIVS
jgi:ethanolamine utilization protein EutP (predicted NTPase)